MSDQNSRRNFLRWVGASSGALLLAGLGCGSQSGAASGKEDTGQGDGDAGRRDAAGRDASADATGPDATGPDATGPDAGPVADASADTGGDAGGDADAGTCEPTGSDVEGPFHVDGAPDRTQLAGPNEPGERLVIEGTVLEADCTTPVAGAVLDVWQADADGNYHDAGDDYRLRGQMMTNANGEYQFETIRPGHYPLGGSTRPAHIHFTITKPGLQPLTTQLYFAGDPFLMPNDPCGNGCNSGDPTLIIDLVEETDPDQFRGTFDIVMQDS
jgi:catechol 1,2-dioxygenase